MQVDVLGLRLPHSPALWEFGATRVQQVVGRFEPRVERVTVRLTDANGHRGGVDKSCSIEVRWRAGSPLVVEALDQDAYVAIDLACSRLKRALQRMDRPRWRRVSGSKALVA